jgi:hypothetical protein
MRPRYPELQKAQFQSGANRPIPLLALTRATSYTDT